MVLPSARCGRRRGPVVALATLLGTGALGGVVGVGACGRPPPRAGRTIAEPVDPLRPVQRRGPVPREAHVVDYTMTARFEPEARRIDGHADIRWRNPTDHPTDQLQMHLYLNGFRAEDTHWMEGGRGTHRGNRQSAVAPWGYCDVTSVTRQTAQGDVALSWAEGDDPSVMTVELGAPLAPGATIEFSLDFSTVLPQVFARTGTYDGFVMAAQWFPKVAVFEPDGTWSNHVFGFHSEFYADFGDYDVTIDVPHPMVVGATGIEVETQDDGERRRVRYRAAMVHDFAWTAWEGFEEWDREHDGVRLRMLAPASFADEVDDHFDAQIATMQSMESRFGAYPWSTVTIVLPPPGANGAMGMEYPTLYTTTPAQRIPRWLAPLGFESRGETFTTVHEFGHQYFQGLLASNEHAEPWVDEGLNTFSNALALSDRHGGDPMVLRLAGRDLTLSQLGRLFSMGRGPTYPIAEDADAFAPYSGAYSAVVYRQTAVLFSTLRALAGPDRFDAAMRTYADRFRFRHPRGSDLVEVLLEELGPRIELAAAHGDGAGNPAVSLDVADFLEQGLHTTHTVDFAVYAVHNRRRPGTAGWHRDEHGALVGGEHPDYTPVMQRADEDVEGLVLIQRLGDFMLPVPIEVRFADGSALRGWWDGRSRLRELRFPGRRVVSVAIDPDGILAMEVDRSNNHRFAPEAARLPTPAEDLRDLAEATALSLMVGVGP